MRRCTIEDSTLADDYIRPGHDTIAVAIEMSPLTYTLRHDTASGFDYDILCDIASVLAEYRPYAQPSS